MAEAYNDHQQELEEMDRSCWESIIAVYDSNSEGWMDDGL
jgi:hypothetical protein